MEWTQLSPALVSVPPVSVAGACLVPGLASRSDQTQHTPAPIPVPQVKVARTQPVPDLVLRASRAPLVHASIPVSQTVGDTWCPTIICTPWS